MRIHKFLAATGIASRRKIEEWIKLGQIKVNNHIAVLGTKVNGNEVFSLDNKIIYAATNSSLTSEVKLFLYHKPRGKICSRSDPLNRANVFTDLPLLPQGRWISVGRLDFNTSGILLFTNNGELAHKLMHPRFNLDRTYLVRAWGEYNPEIIANFIKGVLLSDGIARFKQATLINKINSNSWYKVVLTEGKNLEIKRLFASQNLVVTKLIRIKYGNFVLPRELKPGQGKYLDLAKI